MNRKLVLVMSLLVPSLCVLLTGLNLVVIEASNGYPVHNLNTGLSYTTIQGAIDAIETLNGHSILVDAGTYYENLKVNKSLSLVGESKNNVVIDGNGNRTVIRVEKSNVVITGFTIRNGQTGIHIYGYFSVGHTQIRNNLIIVNNATSDGYGYGGIHVEFSPNNVIVGNLVSDNHQGISVYGDGDNVIEGNVVVNNLDEGIGIGGYDSSFGNNRIENNIISSNGGNGISVDDSFLNTIRNNKVIANNQSGISLTGGYGCYNNTVSNNNVTGNGVGLSFDVSGEPFPELTGQNNITNNHMANNDYGIVILRSSHEAIFNNNFVNNSAQAWLVFTNYSNTWDNGYPSGGNYWSDYEGIDSNSDGIGDTPYIIDVQNQDSYPLMHPRTFGHILPVPYEGQGNTDWCWAASTAMILRYYGRNVHVWDVGKSRAATWSLTQIESFIHKSYPNKFGTTIGRYSFISEQIRTDMEGNLTLGHPIMLNVDTSIGRHIVVVTGFNSTGFFINDPSGAFFVKGLGRILSFPYINEYATWKELQPLIRSDLIDKDTFLIVEGIQSPLHATLRLIDDEAGIRTIHDSDSGKGVCIDYGGWYWYRGLYWRSIGMHPLTWDSKDSLNYQFEICNHENQEAKFDFRFELRRNGLVDYVKSISDVSVPAFDSRYGMELNVSLKDCLIKGNQYVVYAEIKYHESTEVIDSITLPPIYYGVKSSMFAVECPVRMMVIDPDGLRTGYDPVLNQTVNEIPEASYYYGNSSEPEAIFIPNTKDGNYSVAVFGMENGTYNLTCTNLDETGSISTKSFVNIPIEEGESQTYIIPEFQSFPILPLFMLATLLVVIAYGKKQLRTFRQRSQQVNAFSNSNTF